MNDELRFFIHEIRRELELRFFKITDQLEANKLSQNSVMGGIALGLQEAIDFIDDTTIDWDKRANIAKTQP